MSKKKIITFILLSVITIPICLYISSIIHLSLTDGLNNLSFPKLSAVINSVITNERHLKVYILIQSLLFLLSFFITFVQKNSIYESDVGNVTDTIKTPIVVGQGQHGTARWLKEKEFEKVFNKNVLDASKKLEELRFKEGGLIVGYKKQKNGNEDIYYIGDNTHTLTVGATRSGKTRTIVLETIGNLGLAGESMIISDPKSEIFHYTSEFLEQLGYEVIVIDFKSPKKSNRYNYLQPVIDALKEGDLRKAEEYAWNITTSLVGEDNGKMERIWRDGEMSIIAGTIMAVVYENMEHPEFQNLTNVYTFISEMCRTENGVMPMNDYIKKLKITNPASRVFNVARIAPEKTRGSFFTSALATLRLFTSDSVYAMTSDSDFSLKDTGKRKRVIYIVLPDENTTYYPLASLFVNQQYTSLVEVADGRGGELENRTNYILDEFRKFYNNSCFFKYANSWWW